MRKFLLISFLLSSCSSFEMPPAFQYRQVETDGFFISAWQKTDNTQNLYYVYIEGDGNSFNTHRQPTNNPTPKSYLVRKLAAQDTHGNVIYLVRPCQFTKGSQCSQKYWTTARFASEIIDAEYHAVKQIIGNSPVVLIGYSGGAQIAGLMAVTKDLNVKKVITIAGNLDHRAWTEYHHLPPLIQSLNLADYKETFALIPQVHYVGENDKVIPPILTEKFVEDKKSIRIVPNTTHGDGWNNILIDL